MLSPFITRFHDTKLKRSRSRKYLVILLCFQIFIAFAYTEYLLLRQKYQRHFDLEEWRMNPLTACNGNFMGIGNQFLWLKHVKLNRENMAFVIPCNGELPRYWFDRREEGTPYTSWLADIEVMEISRDEEDVDNDFEVHGITFTVRRVEAHNLYHTMCEIYNIFLVHKLFGIDWKDINILFMDSRPPSKMDEIWTGLFGNVIHYDDVQELQRFENMIWIPIGYESPMHRHYLHSIPFASEFQEVFINSFGVRKTKEMNCTSVNYTLILRHDYITHPERVTLFQGKLHRKLANEDSIIQTIKGVIGPKGKLRTVLLESLSMKKQVEIFASTDVLIAVHGAGMAHVLNLPSHAFVLELRPYKFDMMLRSHFYHFRAMSRWKSLKYIYLRSDNTQDSVYTYEINVPVEDLLNKIRAIKCHLDTSCGASDKHCPVLEEP